MFVKVTSVIRCFISGITIANIVHRSSMRSRYEAYDDNGQLFKKCSQCHEAKALTEEFYGRARQGAGGNKHGFYPQCLICKRTSRRRASARRYEANPAYQHALQRKHAEKNHSKSFDISFILKHYPYECTEISTIYGGIDVLTDTQVIEVKKYQHWKKGIGQLMTFGLLYPDHEKVLILLGKIERDNSLIVDACKQLGITCQYTLMP